MTKIKLQIKNRWTGNLIFEYEKEDNTIKDTVLEAIKRGAYLGGADLRGAYLRGANLGGANLGSADLRGANLGSADLRGANLGDADLRGANLGDANLGSADLRDADLGGANLGSADLRGADLGSANLGGANLGDADLRGANLGGAYLRGANLGSADLRDAKNIPYVPFACPSDGAFIGWKKVLGKLVKLEIPEDALRCSATSLKCRCSKAKVLGITNPDGSDCGMTEILRPKEYLGGKTLYKVGEMVFPDSFDEDRWNECSHGIHFFINRQDAINY